MTHKPFTKRELRKMLHEKEEDLVALLKEERNPYTVVRRDELVEEIRQIRFVLSGE